MGGKSGELRVRTLAACFLRCYFVGAAYNTRGLQHVGLAYAMEPGLTVLYPDPETRDKVFTRYLDLYAPLAALAGGLFVAIQVFKAVTFRAGYREGFQVLRRLRRWDLVNLGRRIKLVNAGLLAVFWMLAHPLGKASSMADAVLIGILAAWAATRPSVSREIALLVLAGGWVLLRSMRPA